MKKRIISLALVLVLMFSLCITASAASTVKVDITYRAIKIVLNGEEITPCDDKGNSVEPFIMNSNGSTYLPLRAIAQALGLDVEWVPSTSTIKLTSGGTVKTGAGAPAATKATVNVPITYRDIKVVLDGVQLKLVNSGGQTVEPFIMNSTTYLPLRIIGEALGLQVGWNSGTNTATLTSPQPKGAWYCSSEDYRYYSGSTTYATHKYNWSYNDKGICTYEYYYDSEGTTEEWIYDDRGNNTGYYLSYDSGENYAYSYGYDSQDRLAFKQRSDYDGYSYRVDYTWNGNVRTGRVTDNEGTGFDITMKAVYDGAGRLVKESGTDEFGDSFVYSYDSAGYLLSEEFDTDEGVYGYYYSYDANHNLIREFYSDDTGFEYTITKTYNADGKVLTQNYVENNGYYEKTSYTYGSNGYRDKLSYVSSSGSYTGTYSYSFDENGNMTKETITYSDGEVESWVYSYVYIANA